MPKSPITPATDSFGRLADDIPAIIVRYDLQCRRTYVNKAYLLATGNKAEEVIGTTLYTAWVPDTPPMSEYLSHLQHTLRSGEMTQFPLQITVPTGETLHQQVSIVAERDEDGSVVGATAISYDTTNLFRTQDSLRDSEAKYRLLIESAIEGIAVVAVDENHVPGTFIEVNDALCRRLGYSREELLKLAPSDITHPDYREILHQQMLQLYKQGFAQAESMEWGKDGRAIPVELNARLLTMDKKEYVLAVTRDISERKQTEQELLRTNRYLRTLSSCNETLVHAVDEAALIQDMCRLTVENGEFPLAWIGYLENDGSIRIAASSGSEAERFLAEEIRMSQQDKMISERPAVEAIKSQTVQTVQDIANSDKPQQWKDRAARHGFASAISLPLLVEERTIGSFNIYSAEIGGFDEQSTALLSELAADIAYGIHALRTRLEREHFMMRLQASMHSTIQALSNTTGLRDPYTADHQNRVAKLAVAIAKQMDYSEEQVEVIYLAGVVHDIGIIAVPSEILSKPGRLSDTEMKLVHTHAEASYNLLKSVDFPWPLADIVRQHHERLDGSGYPLGLKGSEIMPEARILAVCDVVEAMLSHRPYRPALGIEAALAEIEQGRETLYDPNVVEVCMALLREGFTFN